MSAPRTADSSQIVRDVLLLDGSTLRLRAAGQYDLLRECREAVEVDLNPVRLTPERCVVLEMRMRVERRAAPQRVKTW